MSRTGIKSTATNTFGYSGIVTLSQNIRGKKYLISKIHNAGGKALFEFLADCLVGDFDIAKVDRPNKILLLKITDETAEDGSIKTNIEKATDTDFIYLLANPEKVANTDNLIAKVRYSFIVPQDVFDGTEFNAIGLYTGTATTSKADIENYAACCKIKDEDMDAIKSTSISSVLVLDWELQISNYNEGV